MGIKRFLFGDRRRKPAETIAKLRVVINRYELKSRAVKRRAGEQRAFAEEMMSEGNRTGAKQALMRRQLYLKLLDATHSKMLNMQRIIESIETVTDNIEMSNVLREADAVINTGLKEVSPEVTEELMLRLEEGMGRAAMADEALSDSSFAESEIDVNIEESIDAELDAMERQLASRVAVAEEASSRPVEGTKEPPISDEKLKAEEAEIEKELNLLKKRLETSQ